VFFNGIKFTPSQGGRSLAFFAVKSFILFILSSKTPYFKK